MTRNPSNPHLAELNMQQASKGYEFQHWWEERTPLGFYFFLKKVKIGRVLAGQATINVVLSNVEAFVFQGGKINLTKNIKAERKRRKPEAKGVTVINLSSCNFFILTGFRHAISFPCEGGTGQRIQDQGQLLTESLANAPPVPKIWCARLNWKQLKTTGHLEIWIFPTNSIIVSIPANSKEGSCQTKHGRQSTNLKLWSNNEQWRRVSTPVIKNGS